MLTGRDLPTVPRELVGCYDVPVPRYTSYPTVPDWTGGFDATDWKRQLGTLSGSTAPLALYVHLPFCASTCHYCGCNATVTTRREVVDAYLARLADEIMMVRSGIATPPRIAALHLGGGTPNFLDNGQLMRLLEMLRTAFPFDVRTELSVEADPRLVTAGQLATLYDLGFRRISFGVQDLDPDVQEAIGRHQPLEMVQSVVALARETGFHGINLDLIYGLPRQTAATFRRTLDAAIALDPDRVACFGYAHVPWMKANQKRIDETTLPARDDRFDLFRMAVESFVDAGYAWIGFDHFAKPEDTLARAAEVGRLHRNFMGYTTQAGENLLGLGTSAISEVGGWFAQSAPKLGDWQRAIDAGTLPLARGHRMTEDDRVRGAAITHLMCNAELPYAMWPEGEDDLDDRFEAHAVDGLVAFGPDRVTVTPRGRYFLRNLGAALDAYRARPAEGPRFSRAV
jgi:oxygen-independent coproporphyrinogen III oxidase